jgi:nicotinamidase-related amidase
MYSAFYAPLQSPRISDSGLADLLREAGTTHVYVVGLAADYCVRSTAADAVREGFVAVVIEEATRAVDPGRWEVCKEVMEREEGVRVVSWDGEEVRKLFAGE